LNKSECEELNSLRKEDPLLVVPGRVPRDSEPLAVWLGPAAVSPGLQRSPSPGDGLPVTGPPAAALDTPGGVYGRHAESTVVACRSPSAAANLLMSRYYKLGFCFHIIQIVCIVPSMTIIGLYGCPGGIVPLTRAVVGRDGAALGAAHLLIGRRA
jgi:hypothetical protein